MSRGPLLPVNSKALHTAAAKLRDGENRALSNGVTVSYSQLEAAAGILEEAPQTLITHVNGSPAGTVSFDPQERPGFVDARRQQPGALVLDVGILPSTTYRIDRDGNAEEVGLVMGGGAA